MNHFFGVAWKFALIWVGAFAGMIAPAEAKCSRRVADPLVVARYQQCNPKKMISYLHNNIVTPYSFQCAKSIQETCVQEGCAKPKNDAELARCQGRYVAILSSCQDEIDGAAKMAMCKDSGEWTVAAVGLGRKPNAIGRATSGPITPAVPQKTTPPPMTSVAQTAAPAVPTAAIGIDPPPSSTTESAPTAVTETPPAPLLGAPVRSVVLRNVPTGSIVLKDFIGPQPAPKPLTRIESDPSREEDMGLASTLDPPPASRFVAPPMERRPDPIPPTPPSISKSQERSKAPAPREYTIEMKTEMVFDMETGDMYAVRKPIRRYKRGPSARAIRQRTQ